jgi:phage shock protein A
MCQQCCDGFRIAPIAYGRERAGENNLRVHELSEQVHELSKTKQELHDQVEHWRFRAQEALEHKALDVMSRDQGQATSAIEDILLDIKKLQQVCFSPCSCVKWSATEPAAFVVQSEAYWRQQAKTLVHDYEEAEGDIRKMFRELQRDREKLRGKEAAEQKLRQEIEFLQKALRSIASTRDSQSSEYTMNSSTYKSSERNDTHPAETPLQDGGHSYLQWQTGEDGESHLRPEASRNGPSAPNLGGPDLHSTYNSGVSAVGNPQRPALVRAAPAPCFQPPEMHKYNDGTTGHPASHRSSNTDAIYSSSSSAHRNNSKSGSHVPASSKAQNPPDFGKSSTRQDRICEARADVGPLRACGG